MLKSRSDRELVEGIRSGDPAAVADLAGLYGSAIRQLAVRYVRNPEDAEEIAQDVLLKVCRKILTFRGDAALSSWIYRITFNAAMSRLRRGRAARAPVAPVEAVERTAWQGGWRPHRPWQPETGVLRDQLRRRLVEALLELPVVYRAPVILRDLHGLSTEEASARLKVKNDTLKSRLHRGRLILRRRLAPLNWRMRNSDAGRRLAARPSICDSRGSIPKSSRRPRTARCSS